MNKVLTLLAKYHNEWISIAKSRGAGAYAEDCVQDAYLKIYDSKKNLEDILYKDNEPNKLFMWMVINSVVTDMLRKRSTNKHAHHNVNKEEISIDWMYSEGVDMEEQEAFERLYDKTTDLLDSMYWYDKKLSYIYFPTDMSMMTISEETGISKKSIFDTLKKIKEVVQEHLGEDYEDYKNGNFDLI